MKRMPTETPTNWCTPVDPSLLALLARLESQSLKPDFRFQREMALSLALEPYLDPRQEQRLSPLPEEINLAQLYLYADYWPDGHPTLVEQIRDLVSEHVPEEERVWLDAVRHSYMDLLEIIGMQSNGETGTFFLRSLGSDQEFQVKTTNISGPLKKGQVLLTRLIRQPHCASLPGTAVVVSKPIGQTIFTFTDDLRRGLEVESGEFSLADWPEFAKRYGYLMIWSLSKVRLGALAIADSRVEYLNADGDPYFYSIAVYEHHEFRFIAEGLDRVEALSPYHTTDHKRAADSSIRLWIERGPRANSEISSPIVARVTLTPSQIFVETDSFERLDSLKHQLASNFGFSLHFKDETTTPPSHVPPEVDLLSDTYFAPPIVVSSDEEHSMLSSFLESVYLEWAEQPSPSLNGETPRHYCSKSGDKAKVAALIDQMERHDLAYRRTGKRGYDYTILRGHVGL